MVAQADVALMRSLASHNRAAIAHWLDPEFTWIDSRGKSLDRVMALQNWPLPANTEEHTQVREYGTAAVVRTDRGQMHVLRIWVRRSTGWRALLYQEVLQVAKSESPAPGSSDCENPCRSIPFIPQTANEKAAVASWQGVMRAMASNDADAYARLIADEFTATDTHHARPFSKSDRLAQIQKLKLTGAHSAPPPLVSARMFDFGQTVLMIAREQRAHGKPYFNTRMWVNRDGRWQMLFSFNTRIE
ncbi:MAG TPA: nuclear transport factor 2 family protein [Terriglobales bacterium]|nr:nuclear transport factor 2 family protein [Terriglobales bacterium]